MTCDEIYAKMSDNAITAEEWLNAHTVEVEGEVLSVSRSSNGWSVALMDDRYTRPSSESFSASSSGWLEFEYGADTLNLARSLNKGQIISCVGKFRKDDRPLQFYGISFKELSDSSEPVR
jgi:hypothetical protein